VTHTIKGLRAQFKEQGKFHTPPELAGFLRSLIPGVPRDVYDPTCGAGALLSVFPDEVPKFGQDIDTAALADAELIPNMTTVCGDVLIDPAWIDKRFHAIVANPPFSIRWEPQADERFMYAPTVPTASRADYAFLIHIMHMLADDGVAAVLNFPGILYRGNREGVLREWFIRNNWVDKVILIPGDTFTDTSISTVCLVLRKDRTGDTIRFEDREHDVSRDVPVSEVEAAGFTLSVSSFVQPEMPEAEPFDAWGAEQLARNGAARKLRSELRFSRQVARFEGWPFAPFIEQLDEVLNEFRESVK